MYMGFTHICMRISVFVYINAGLYKSNETIRKYLTDHTSTQRSAIV